MIDIRNCSQSGFTLVELLVASAIIAVLAGLAVQAYVIHRETAFHGMALQMMGQTRTAMEAGKIDSEEFTENLFFSSTASGPATEMDGAKIVPGLVLPEDFYVSVFHNPHCSIIGCMEDYVITRHCNINQRVVYWKSYKVGEAFIASSLEPNDC